VEKNLIANSDETFFAIPNVLISSDKPWIPVSNTSNQPQYICKGKAVRTLIDPASHFDKPKDEAMLQEYRKMASLVAQMVINSQEDKPTMGLPPEESMGNDLSEESYRPKTVEMADMTNFPSTKLEELIDVVDLPEHLKERAWEMLWNRQKAFGFDGCLGYLKTKAHIRTADGQVPIAIPTYGSSPAKKEVIDQQLDIWFEQGVIEPSISPWSALVVIMLTSTAALYTTETCIQCSQGSHKTTPFTDRPTTLCRHSLYPPKPYCRSALLHRLRRLSTKDQLTHQLLPT
jgi:hypothetical protein